MIVDIIEDITEALPRYVLKNDGTVQLENTGSIGARKRKPSPTFQESFLEGNEEIYREKRRQKRNAKLRTEAIKEHGLKCYVCAFNFEEAYENYGAGYIEVHHLELLAKIKGEREFTIKDVRVVCSNCHSVLHRQGRKPMDIDELKNFYEAKRKREKNQG